MSTCAERNGAADANGRKQLAIQKRLAQLQHVLDNSKSPTAQVVACNSLTALPERIGDLVNLRRLDASGWRSLTALRERRRLSADS